METSHLPSYENCQKLKEIWFPQEGYYWYETESKTIDDKKGMEWQNRACEWLEWVYAPSVMEMIDIMPMEDIIITNEECTFENWCDFVITFRWDWFTYEEKNEDLPNALAEMIIWLHENNFISFNK